MLDTAPATRTRNAMKAVPRCNAAIKITHTHALIGEELRRDRRPAPRRANRNHMNVILPASDHLGQLSDTQVQLAKRNIHRTWHRGDFKFKRLAHIHYHWPAILTGEHLDKLARGDLRLFMCQFARTLAASRSRSRVL
jgi:hypothetical protein